MTLAMGIMQGRLVPPVGDRIQCFPQQQWRDEFAQARSAGIAAIEWIYDVEDAAMNPIGTAAGVEAMRALSAAHGVGVPSVCADYFMSRPLAAATATERRERLEHLHWLLGRCREAGVGRVVLPFVDASRIDSAAALECVVTLLRESVPVLEQTGVELHLETELAPAAFRSLLDAVPHRSIAVTYDSGNSAALGYEPREEVAAYGDRIRSVHIKDRRRGGGTVPLGTGDTDFGALFAALRRRGFTGPWVLQAARGEAGAEVEWTRRNVAFVGQLLEIE